MAIGNLYSGNGKYIKKPAFFKRNGWYWDVRIWFPVFLILIYLITIQYNTKISELRLENDRMIVEMSAVEEQEIVEETPAPTESCLILSRLPWRGLLILLHSAEVMK